MHDVNRVLAEAAVEFIILTLFANNLEDEALHAGGHAAASCDHWVRREDVHTQRALELALRILRVHSVRVDLVELRPLIINKLNCSWPGILSRAARELLRSIRLPACLQ